MNLARRNCGWLCLGLCWCAMVAGHAEESPLGMDAKSRQLVEKLRNRNRDIDPFGCAMNPAKKAALVIEAPPIPEKEEPAPERTSLELALQSLSVNGVNPDAKTVLMGARRYHLGDHLVVQHNETKFRLELSAVSLESITFSDLESGQKAVHQLAIAPQLLSRKLAAQAPHKAHAGTSRFVLREP